MEIGTMISMGMQSQPKPIHHLQEVDYAVDMFEFLPKLLRHADYREGQQNSQLYHSLVLRLAV
jgi:hypothetical protein